MRVPSLFAGAALLAAVTFAPAQASAQGQCTTPPTAFLGIGGYLTGCFSFTLVELGENAGYTSNQYFWASNFGLATGAPNNGAVPPGTQFFNDDCGSSGNTGFTNFRFCVGPTYQPSHSTGPFTNPGGELVFGLDTPDHGNNPANSDYYVYSGPTGTNRNAYPGPDGDQAILFQLESGGVPITGEYLLGWEDINSGCNSLVGNPQYFDIANIGNAQVLDTQNVCNGYVGNVQGPSDSDFNDSYIRISITGGTLSTVPEPMTMTLMASGLVGLAGAQFRRRRKAQQS